MKQNYPFAGCGFAGVVALNETTETSSRLNCNAMLNSLSHRGPEDSGQWESPSVWLGHRRLSILDLSSKGHQPMVRDDLTVVSNGEIYNFIEIRNELISKGFVFISDTDTEVIIRAYQYWGEKCLERFNGMFAFAIWDCTKQKLFVARDRIGIKPFYYYQDKQYFIFGSEVQALLHSGIIPPSINYEGIKQQILASSNYDYDESRTLIKNVFSLPAGCFMELDKTGVCKQKTYWTIPTDKKNESKNIEQLTTEFNDIFEDSIRLQLVSDVPVAAFLSGGMDSSLINVVASKQLGKHKLTGITVKYEGGGKDIHTGLEDEDLVFSKIIAESIKDKLDHRIVTVSPANITIEAIDQISDFAGFFDDIRALSILNNYKVVREQGYKVVLNGQGADEIMGGYIALNFFEQKILNVKEPNVELIKKLFSSWQFPSNDTLNKEILQSKPEIEKNLYEFYHSFSGNLLEKSHRFLTQTLLKSILKFEDYLSMQHSIECRVPFLDHRIIEWAFSFPFEKHINTNQGLGKMLMRKASESILPREIISRPKQTFPSPNQENTHKALLSLYSQHHQEIKESELIRYIYSNEFLEIKEPKISLKELWLILVVWRWENKLNKLKTN